MDDKNDKVARARRALAKTPPEVRCWETPLTLHAPRSWGWAVRTHMSAATNSREFANSVVSYTLNELLQFAQCRYFFGFIEYMKTEPMPTLM